jgi:hypothetical protein
MNLPDPIKTKPTEIIIDESSDYLASEEKEALK